jgi:hypothetical protein
MPCPITHNNNTRFSIENCRATYAGNASSVAKNKFSTKLKDSAAEDHDSGHVLLCNQSINISSAVALELPTVKAMKKTVRRKRNNMNLTPKSPSDASELTYSSMSSKLYSIRKYF